MIYLFLFISLMILAGCEQKPVERQYTEVIIEAPKAEIPAMMPAVHAADLTWTLPQGWMEGAAQGMRLATFHLKNAPKDIDVSIVALDGMAGGLQANLGRWLGQIQLSVSEDALTKLIARAQTVKTTGPIEAKIYDFTALTDGEDTGSMIAAMMFINGKTVFVKMTGSKDHCRRQKDNLLGLVRSISAP